MKKIGIVLLSLACANLIACVEVRDPAKENQAPHLAQPEPQPALNQAQELPDLIVDQVMYVYEGRIMNEEQIEDVRSRQRMPKNWSPGAPGVYRFQYRKIDFRAQGVLYTFGNSIDLIADSIESNRGRIVSFEPGAKAAFDQVGRSGGHVRIKANRGEGQLFAEFRGENGGDGSRGKDGQRGPSGELKFLGCGNLREENLSSTPGLPGKRGGNSGSLYVLITENPKNFDYKIISAVGVGGKGGLAGRATQCDGVMAGSWQGIQAADGADGADGEIEK